MQDDQKGLVAVVGAGTMGAGIALVAALAGHAVIVVDADQDALQRAGESTGKAVAKAVARGEITSEAAAATADRLRWSEELNDLQGAGLVIEAIIERAEAKADLFERVAALTGRNTILATNTSSLPIEALAERIEAPERFVGLHFFNPASVMRLVEVIPGSRTSAEVVSRATEMMRAWGKRPVIVRDVPGFIVNRVARPYYAEGFLAMSEGIAPATIDRALTSSGGFKMGPLALADLIGHDVNYAVAASIFGAYHGATRFRPQSAQRALVDAGRLGRKSGAGVYDGSSAPAALLAPSAPSPTSIRVAATGGTAVKLFREAGLICHDDPALPRGLVEVDGVRLAMTDGRPLSTRDDVDVLADVARDFAATNTIVLTARDERAGAAVAGLVQATGRSALFVPDRPGMIVLRTLAQLANAAADAVADDVASIDAVDEALTYGANHPEGPLHWAERSGFQRVADALVNIADATGDEIYRPASMLTES